MLDLQEKSNYMQDITFRQAAKDDAPFVATVMMEAVGIPMMEEGRTPEPHLVEICQREDTLYSYKNCIIATAEGKPVGGLISYPGTGYHEVRVRTFSMVRQHLSFDIEQMDDETRDGEYYLDSAAVLPEHRGKGIGRQLIEYGVKKAHELHLLPTLACFPDNTSAYKLYTSIGFKENGHLFIFGEDYLRMTL